MNAISKICVCTLLAVLLCGCSVRKQLRKADFKYNAGAYYDAAAAYRKVSTRINRKDRALKAEVNFKMGECYRRIGVWNRAVRSYASAVKGAYPDSIVYLYLGKCYHAQGNYKYAMANYNRYLQAHPQHREAQEGLLGAENAARQRPTRYVTQLAAKLNSRRNSDFSPMYMGGGTERLMLTSNRSSNNASSKDKTRKPSAVTGTPHFDLFTTQRNKAGQWEPLKALDAPINTPDDEGTPSFTADGKTLYFTRCWAEAGETRGGEIMQCTRSGGLWANPVTVRLFNDSTITAAHPAITANGDTLFFVSDAPKGIGGKDIWMALHLDKGGWGIPENLGPDINTTGDEMFPYIRDNGTLYFASNGHAGFGGLDLFEAHRDTNGRWHVHNMLPPINSNGDDFGITFRSGKEEGFFSSNRNQNRGLDRIYSFELPALVYAITGAVTDEKGTPLPDAMVRIVGNDGTNTRQRTKKDGSFRIKIDKNVKYVLLATCRGYLNSSASVATDSVSSSEDFRRDFRLPGISRPVKMDNIFYEFGKWTLTQASEAGLNYLVKLLNDNPHITIEIAAHTDMIGSDESNLTLSQKRAQSVVNYLIQAGIERERLTSIGYGETRPVTVDAAMAAEYGFLHEGDTLTPDFIEKLPEEQQEIANQINRRTEFKVVRTTYRLY